MSLEHPRDLTKEIFANNATIDGMRLNKAIKEVISEMNNVKRGYIADKWVENRIIRAYQPTNKYNINGHKWPWLRAFNRTSDISAGTTVTTRANKHREKGYARKPFQDENEASGPLDTQQYIWSDVLYFKQPAILIDWTLIMQVDGTGSIGAFFENDWDTGLDDYGNVNQARRDMVMRISVDSPLDSEDRALGSTVAIQRDFSLRDSQISTFGWGGGFTDGYPAGYPSGPLHGVFRRLDMNIPVPAGSRVRTALIIPYYDDTSAADNRGWHKGSVLKDRPWFNQMFNHSLSFLEPVENGKD